MSLDKILSITGKPGLYKLLTQTRTGFVAESLLDGKKVSVNLKSNVSVLSEIAIYTLEEEVPLRSVFLKIQEKEAGGKTTVSHKDEKVKLEEYFFEVLPDYDEDRVYASDIKKIVQWYNLLHDHGVVDFTEKEKEEAAVEEEKEATKATPKPAKKEAATSKKEKEAPAVDKTAKKPAAKGKAKK